MPHWLIAFIILDVVITATVVALFVSGRIKLNVDFKVERSVTDLRALTAFTKDKHERIGEYVRANWSGAPEQLPRVLESLLVELERDAQTRGITISHEMLKSIVASSVRTHRIARGGDLEQAMRQVA